MLYGEHNTAFGKDQTEFYEFIFPLLSSCIVCDCGCLSVCLPSDPDLSIFLWRADRHTQRRHTCLIPSNSNGTDSALNSSPITHLVMLSVLDLASSNRGVWMESLSPSLYLSLSRSLSPSYFFFTTLLLSSSPPTPLLLSKPHNEFLSGFTEILLFFL